MADPRIYENAAVFVGGLLFSDATSISVAYEDGDRPLPLIGGAFAIDAGTRIMRIAVAQSLPVGSSGLGIMKAWQDVELVEFGAQLLGSGLRLTTRGYITTPRYEFGVGKNAELAFGFIGPAAMFQ